MRAGIRKWTRARELRGGGGVAGERTEADGATDGRPHRSGVEPQRGRTHTGAVGRELQSSTMRGASSELRTFPAGSGRVPAKPALERLVQRPRNADIEQFRAGSRSAPVLPARGRKLLAALPTFKAASTGASLAARFERTSSRVARRRIAPTLRRLPTLAFLPQRTSLARGASEQSGLRAAAANAETGMMQPTHMRAPTSSADATPPRTLRRHSTAPYQAQKAAARNAARVATTVRPGLRFPQDSGSASPLPQAPASTLSRWMPSPMPQPDGLRMPTAGTLQQILTPVAPAAPRALAPPAAAPIMPASSPTGAAADIVPASPVYGPVGNGSLDATRVARWLARALGADAARPPAAGAGFDPRRTPAWIPSSYTKAT